MTNRSGEAAPVRARRFPSTHWSVVLAAQQPGSPEAAAALDALCRAYWYPLYAYTRRQGYSPEDAEDLIQGFFARILERRDFETIRREKGRFRSFLLVSLKHFIVNERLRARAARRGGGRVPVPLDEAFAEGRYQAEPADHLTPEVLFERRWALAVLERTLDRLRDEYRAAGKNRQFENLKGFLSDEAARRSQAEIAAELGTSEGAVKQAVHRLRRRYRELLREEVAHTVASVGDVEDELRHLIAALRG